MFDIGGIYMCSSCQEPRTSYKFTLFSNPHWHSSTTKSRLVLGHLKATLTRGLYALHAKNVEQIASSLYPQTDTVFFYLLTY